MNPWQLPRQAVIGGETYLINADYRDILDIFSYLNDPDLPEIFRWRIAVALFYEGEVPAEYFRDAVQYLSDFIRCGADDRPGPQLLDWQKDGAAIISDVNKAAGQEVRALPFVHWWTFLAWFQAIGQGQLSAIVSIRDKLRRGKKLEGWEKDFYRENKSRVELPKRYTSEELARQERLKRMLGE